MKTKKQCQREHAVRRAAERYDIRLNDIEYDRLVEKIEKGSAKLMEKQSNRISIYKLSAAFVTVLVAFDRKRRTIVTFLPQHAFYNKQYAKPKTVPQVEICRYCAGKVTVDCKYCVGTGMKRGEECEECDGTGKFNCAYCY